LSGTQKKPLTQSAAVGPHANNPLTGSTSLLIKRLARFFDPQITPAWTGDQLARKDATEAGDICLGGVELAVAAKLAILVLRKLGFINASDAFDITQSHGLGICFG
jgi:hypothetical protein